LLPCAWRHCAAHACSPSAARAGGPQARARFAARSRGSQSACARSPAIAASLAPRSSDSVMSKLASTTVNVHRESFWALTSWRAEVWEQRARTRTADGSFVMKGSLHKGAPLTSQKQSWPSGAHQISASAPLPPGRPSRPCETTKARCVSSIAQSSGRPHASSFGVRSLPAEAQLSGCGTSSSLQASAAVVVLTRAFSELQPGAARTPLRRRAKPSRGES
jgi:hypothetical protein